MPFSPPRSRFTPWRSALALGLALSFATVAVVTEASAATPSVASLVKAANAAVKAQTSVRVAVQTFTGKTDSSLTANLGPTSGFESYRAGTDTFTISLTSTYAYVKGSQSALINVMGLSKAEAKKLGTRTMSMKAGTSPYSTFKTVLTYAALTNLFPPTKQTTLLKKRDKKSNGYQIAWSEKKTKSTPASSTVFVISSSAKSLPIRETVHTSSGRSITAYSHWNEKIQVATPSNPVPYETIFKS